MPRKKKRSKPDEDHTHLSLRIEDYKVRATAAINHFVHNPLSWLDMDEEPLFEFETHLEIKALCTDPQARAGDSYDLTIYSDVRPSIYLKLKDVQVVDEHRTPQYKTYRGKQIPIYKAPLGMGSLEKVRGEARWRGTIWAQPRYITDVLILLGQNKQLYVSLHEQKVERQRWIQGMTIQTTDPVDE